MAVVVAVVLEVVMVVDVDDVVVGNVYLVVVVGMVMM